MAEVVGKLVECQADILLADSMSSDRHRRSTRACLAKNDGSTYTLNEFLIWNAQDDCFGDVV
jgi:hypothetical protein